MRKWPIEFVVWTPTPAEADQMRAEMESWYLSDEEYETLWWQCVREQERKTRAPWN